MTSSSAKNANLVPILGMPAALHAVVTKGGCHRSRRLSKDISSFSCSHGTALHASGAVR